MTNGKYCSLPPAYASCLLCLVHRQSGVFPRIHSTQQRRRVFDSFFSEIKHRTGARMFVWSRAVRDNRLIAGYFI